jgi:cyclic pyranopterin monophosphate synthase
MSQFSHTDQDGNISMVDVSEKQVTRRTATARAIVRLPPEVMALLVQNDIVTAKGSVFTTARLAGIMAAKDTGRLIPLCHSLAPEHCAITIERHGDSDLVVDCSTVIFAKTGVEMEALVGASVAALTIYDMCKAISHGITILETRLIEKTGGKNDFRSY